MAIDVNISTTVDVDDSIKLAFTQEFIVAYEQANVMEPFVEFNEVIGAKSIDMPRYDSLLPATTPLSESTEVTSVKLVDSEVLFTPLEYGNAVARSMLADLQTGGTATRAAMRVVGNNMARTQNVLAIRALETTTNISYAGSATSDVTVSAGDTIDTAALDLIYNKLARASVPAHPATGTYVAFAHDDVIHDLRTSNSAGTWTDVNKYNNEIPVLMNEIGMYKGFRWVRNNDALLDADAGATGTVDVYRTSFLGFNGLGKAQSLTPTIVISGPFDTLQRQLHIGWKGVFTYGLVEPAAVRQLRSSSSIGANT